MVSIDHKKRAWLGFAVLLVAWAVVLPILARRDARLVLFRGTALSLTILGDSLTLVRTDSAVHSWWLSGVEPQLVVASPGSAPDDLTVWTGRAEGVNFQDRLMWVLAKGGFAPIAFDEVFRARRPNELFIKTREPWSQSFVKQWLWPTTKADSAVIGLASASALKLRAEAVGRVHTVATRHAFSLHGSNSMWVDVEARINSGRLIVAATRQESISKTDVAVIDGSSLIARARLRTKGSFEAGPGLLLAVVPFRQVSIVGGRGELTVGNDPPLPLRSMGLLEARVPASKASELYFSDGEVTAEAWLDQLRVNGQEMIPRRWGDLGTLVTIALFAVGSLGYMLGRALFPSSE